MSAFAQFSVGERAAFVREAAARLDVLPEIVEKDFWVCWMLQRIFQSSPAEAHLVFKGGTSLSKVFGAIKRFSEDIGGPASCLATKGPRGEFKPGGQIKATAQDG